jgi:hypothetical protein
MTDSLEIIAAFVDRERVDPDALKQALSTDEGRSYLVDLVALREVVAEPAFVAAAAHATPRLSSRLALVAASLMFLSVGAVGFAAGWSIAPASTASKIVAPPPAREIPIESGRTWIETTGGF